MPGRLPMKNDNELHCQEAVDKNSGYSLHHREGLREFRRSPFRWANQGGSLMKRREFTKVMGAVAAGLTAGSLLRADEKPADKAEKNICKGHNSCKGKGGCKSGDAGCAGKNSCKGKGGCASASAKHDCKGKNECKGMGGCKSGDAGCAGKNSCKGKGGCAVPVKH
jgi:hypothetical protein